MVSGKRRRRLARMAGHHKLSAVAQAGFSELYWTGSQDLGKTLYQG
jgi:hypothetical protein